MMKEQKNASMEANIIKPENEYLKGEVKRLQTFSSRLEQNMKTKELEYKTTIFKLYK